MLRARGSTFEYNTPDDRRGNHSRPYMPLAVTVTEGQYIARRDAVENQSVV